MKKLLLSALTISWLCAGSQTSITNGDCRAFYKWEVNHQLMTPVPSTAINFYDRSEGKVLEWYWDFGNGNTSREQNPLFIFYHPTASPDVKIDPYRTVSLTILTDSCKSFYSEVINIFDGTPYVEPDCKAGFKYYQAAYDSVGGTATIQLTNLSEGDSLNYLWRFDNGKTSTEKEPAVTFDIRQLETKVCLTITGKNECSDTYCAAVTIYNPKIPAIDPAYCKTAFGYSINYNVKTFAPALVLDFYSKAYPEAVKWHWDFGDGSTSDEPNPMHIFNLPLNTSGDTSSYRKVCLTVKTTTGCEATYCETINIFMEKEPYEGSPECHAWFKYQKATDVVTIPELIPYRFTDVSEAKVVSRLWQFEDGKTSTEAEPLVTFDFLKPTQKVCLTINTDDGCQSTRCEIINVSEVIPDTLVVYEPDCPYIIRYTSGFPVQMSSCAGYAKAQVYLKDSLVKAESYVWSTGVEGQEVKGLCPTQTYSVKAKTADGCIVYGMFKFNSDGTVTEIPVNWWVGGSRDKLLIQSNVSNPEYTVEWRLCDGTVVKSTSIPLDSINCGSKESNLILKDASGNVIYTENISMKTLVTGINSDPEILNVKIFPNPVKDILNILYLGETVREMQVSVFDLAGKQLFISNYQFVFSGQLINIDVTGLPKGVYFCRMIADQKIISTEKIIK